jgi:hypothetical protein
MPSPFPGMDPYVESQWKSFHGLMIGAITSALNRTLPVGLVAQMEEEVRVETLAGERLQGYGPDVSVVENEASRPGVLQAVLTAGAAVIEPVPVAYRRAPLVMRSIRIVETGGNKVVTAVELLSPWNKLPGRLNRDYRRKLCDFERAEINWVEIDLLRSRRDWLAERWDDLPADRRATYLVVAWRAAMDEAIAWPISLRQPLPPVSVPLRERDSDINLDLQQAFERAYADGPFRAIEYSKPIDPPLSPEDTTWALKLRDPI